MATICFSMSGEGRGHATRVRALVERLRTEGHRLVLFAPGDAFDLLAPAYRGTPVRVVRIPGLRFAYAPDGHLDSIGTGLGAVRYAMRLPRLVSRLERYLHRLRPDLAVVDFEPALPRAARRAGVPYIAVNHQHFLVADRLTILPPGMRARAWLMGRVVRLYHRHEREVVISQFYFPPVKRRWRNRVTHAGVLLRPEIEAAQPTDEGFLLVYLKKFATSATLAALRGCGVPVRVYGLGERPAEGAVEFRAVSTDGFARDLAACTALLCTSGNQLVGEALYLGKPVFALPEPNNDEQMMNCLYLADSGAGRWADMNRVTADDVRTFLGNLDKYRSRIDRRRMNGTPVAMEAIRRHLERPAPARP